MLRFGCQMMARSRRIASQNPKLATEVAGEARRYIEHVQSNVRWNIKAQAAAQMVTSGLRPATHGIGAYLARSNAAFWPVDRRRSKSSHRCFT
jgi:hypothetical protein